MATITPKTYRELVNLALEEAAVTNNAIGTGGDFTSPVNYLHTRFKSWVKQAWVEIQCDTEYDFMKTTHTGIIYPRVYVEQVTAGTAPAVNEIFAADDTNETDVSFKLVAKTYTGTTGAEDWTTGSFNFVGYFDIDDLDGTFKFNEPLDHYQSNGTTLVTADKVTISGWGAYNFRTIVSDLWEIDITTVTVSTIGNVGIVSGVEDADSNTGVTKLKYVPWDVFHHNFGEANTLGCPQYFSKNPAGDYEFFPRLDKPYVISFKYTREVQELATETEAISYLPVEYQDYIAYRAVLHYAEYDNKALSGSNYKRVKDKCRKYHNLLALKHKKKHSFIRWSS